MTDAERAAEEQWPTESDETEYESDQHRAWRRGFIDGAHWHAERARTLTREQMIDAILDVKFGDGPESWRSWGQELGNPRWTASTAEALDRARFRAGRYVDAVLALLAQGDVPAEVERLRAIIASAPHAMSCAHHTEETRPGGPRHAVPCDCWKTRVDCGVFSE